MIWPDETVYEGKPATIKCRTWGSRPKAKLEWEGPDDLIVKIVDVVSVKL